MDSMEEIYLKHGKMVYGFLLTRTQDPDLAEELTQETFYRAVKNIGKYKGKSSVSTWLCGIAKNLWYEYARSRKNHVTLEEAGEIPVDSAETQLFHSWDSIQDPEADTQSGESHAGSDVSQAGGQPDIWADWRDHGEK